MCRLDRAVAEAADAQLNDPRDYQAYRYLVVAMLARRAGIQPSLGEALVGTQKEARVDEHPARPIADDLHRDPVALLNQLRGQQNPSA